MVELHTIIARLMDQGDHGVRKASYTTALAVEIPLLILAVTTVALRVFSRLAIKRKLAADDILIILGTSAAIARTVISCMSADDNWSYDRKGPDLPTEVPYYQHIFSRRIAYLFAVTLTRFSVLTYYLRIFPPSMSSLRLGCYVLLALALILFIEVFTVLLVYCKDITTLWTPHWLQFTGSQCFTSAVYSYSAAIGDSIIDSLIFTLPIPYVWGLSKLRARQRIGLVVVFGLGLVVCVVALLQIPFIKKREGNGMYFGGGVNVLVAVQVQGGIVAASLPDLRALGARWIKVSTLHPRSQVTGAEHGNVGQAEAFDEERGEGMQDARMAFDGKRVLRKPDWMRDSMPASLMSTMVTQTEITSLSHGSEEEEVRQVLRVPGKALT